MSLATIIYLASVCGGLCVFFGVFGSILTCMSIFIGCVVGIKTEAFPRKAFIITAIGIVCLLLAAIIPDKDTVYLMTGANATQQAFSTPEAAKARKVLNLGLDKIIDNLQESK